jgi:hypothetical protein
LILKKKKKPKPAKRKPHNAFLKAKHYQKLLQHKVVKNNNELAEKEGFTRARVTQILNLLKLAPEIQEYLSKITDKELLRFFTERRLRKIAAIKDHKTQLKRFQKLKKEVGIREDSLFEMIDQN